jgi:hypothetical protein
VWTYRAAGLDGRSNPSGDRIRFETINDVETSLTERLSAPQAIEERDVPGLRLDRPEPETGDLQDLSQYPGPVDQLDDLETHLRQLSDALTYRSPGLRASLRQWRRSLDAAETGIGSRALDAITDMATVQTAMTVIGATWLIYGD